NEVHGPTDPAVHEYIDLVRKRAGLKSVEESWRLYSVSANKPATKEGMRSIIQQERMIEFAFEGQRYWDLRRWRIAHTELSKPIVGWNITEKEPQSFYKQVVIFQPQFKIRDYFWPISENERLRNDKIKQNPGW